MKTMHLLGLSAIASICMITTTINCASPEEYPLEKAWRREALEAYLLGKQKELGREATRMVQEYLIPTVPVQIINTDDAISLKITFRNDQIESKVATTKVYIKPIRMPLGPNMPKRAKGPVQRVLRIPIIPLSVNIDDIEKKGIHLWSFKLDKEEIQSSRAIKICNYAAVIEYTDGSNRIIRFYGW